jgi:hypothetical protein
LCYFEFTGYSFYLHSQINCFYYCYICFLITECDQGTFGKECKSRCHCLNGVGCNNVNGQCPRGHCDAGWKTNTCSEGKEFLLSY